MRVYVLEILVKGTKGWTRNYTTNLEDAVDQLAAVLHRDGFEQAILLAGDMVTILTYTNPREPAG